MNAKVEPDMSLIINDRFDVDESIRCAKLRLTKTIYGARHFTVVYQIPGNCNYPITCNSIIDQAKSQHYRISAWSMDDEICRLSIIHDAFEANDMAWIEEVLTEDGIGDYLSLDAVIDSRKQAEHLASET